MYQKASNTVCVDLLKIIGEGQALLLLIFGVGTIYAFVYKNKKEPTTQVWQGLSALLLFALCEKSSKKLKFLQFLIIFRCDLRRISRPFRHRRERGRTYCLSLSLQECRRTYAFAQDILPQKVSRTAFCPRCP